MKEQDFDHTSREGWDGCVNEGAGYAIEGWNGYIDEGIGAAIEGWSY